MQCLNGIVDVIQIATEWNHDLIFPITDFLQQKDYSEICRHWP